MRTIGIGVIGTGFMGLMHSYSYANLPFYYEDLPFRPKLIGVAGTSPQKANAFAGRCGFIYGTEDWRNLLQDDDIEVISVCTPNHLHEQMVIAALEAGKHVYCDKPLTISVEAARRIENAAIRSARIHGMAMNNRFYPSVLRAREWVDLGGLGRITGFRGAYLHSGSVDPDRRVGWKQQQGQAGGGVLLDLGSHLIDLLQYITGQSVTSLFCSTQILYPQRPDGQGNIVNVDAEDAVHIIAKLPDGGFGTLEATKIAGGIDDQITLDIHGTNGAIKLDLAHPDQLLLCDLNTSDTPYGGDRGFKAINCAQRYQAPGGQFPPSKLAIGWTRAHVHSLYTFMDHVTKGNPHTPSLIDGARLQQTLSAAYESARTSAWVAVSTSTD